MGSVVGRHSVHSQATKNGEVSSSKSDSSQGEGDGTEEEDNTKAGKSGIKTSSDEQEAKISRSALTPSTPSLVLVSEHEDTNPESDSGKKVQTAWQKQCKGSPKEDSPKKDSSRSSSSEEEPPTDEVLRDGARRKVWLLYTCFDAWCCDKIANNVTGWVM